MTCPVCADTGISVHRGRRCVCPRCRGGAQTLFELTPPDPLVRTTDPETSKAAAKSVDVNPREREVIDALRLLTVASSAFEIAECMANYGLSRDKNCVSRRLTSLTRKGLVDARGVKPGPYGRTVTAYRLASAA